MEDAELKWTLASRQDTTSTLDRDIRLLLYQKKAYDRVNLSYFRAVLNWYGFPGDPISCICYGLPFEPFLQSILQEQDFRGYELQNQEDATGLDLRLLKCYMDLFCRASNAHLNYSKVGAFPLSSCNTSGYWSQALVNLNIHYLHTASDPKPLIYLGFPLTQSTLQCTNSMAALIQKLRKTLQPHFCRSVSVLGKATIANKLLLSKCWYILRVIPLIQKGIQQITSVAIQFLKKGIFPIFSFLHLDSPSSTDNSLLTILIYHINNQNRSSCHQIPLLFPVALQQLTKTRRVSTIGMIYRSIDMLPRSFAEVTINLPTALMLPLSTVIYSDRQCNVKLPRKIHAMTVANVFAVHPTEQFLHWKRSFDPSLAIWQRAPRQLIQGISKGTFKLQPFFLPLCVPSAAASPSPPSPSLRPFVTHLTK
ncbi:hypothetical protein MAM1_0271c09024 [Mucor ambiguus]|uniref:Reverse transcriptase domain-containing protein n=1 Tax=Mucor ambiguus TaxID=91626 RepID=A0A0C9MPU9_9FUNG|nr:hypothetical protein MAM1_0271c09024 [Mucor ambiguus]